MKEKLMWLINKTKIEREHAEEDKQYNDRLIDIKNLRKENQKLKNELQHQIDLKKIYLANCKRISKKLKLKEEELERERSIRVSMSKSSRARKYDKK